MELFSSLSDLFFQFIDILLHIDVHLEFLVKEYGVLVYVLLGLIIFCETGLVVTPFLPGDSLLFAGGTLVGAGLMSYVPLVATLLFAAILGDFVNYRIGRYIGPPVFQKNYRFLQQKHLQKAHDFYMHHGGKAIIFARFIPLIRTFAPFIAGVAEMPSNRFLFFNVIGAVIWVVLLVTAGYLLAHIPFVKNNFSFLVYGIIVVSVVPFVVEVCRQMLKNNTDK